MHKTDLIWGGTWGAQQIFGGACAPPGPPWRRHCDKHAKCFAILIWMCRKPVREKWAVKSLAVKTVYRTDRSSIGGKKNNKIKTMRDYVYITAPFK